MQALKAMVILMGVLIVGAIAVLSYGLMNDWHKKKNPIEEAAVEAPESTLSMPSPAMASATRLNAFGDWKILLPTDAVIVEATPENNILYMRYEASNNTGGVIILDLTDQKKIGHIQY